ncbi:MAG: hypothetical protein IJJ82_07045 [Clostridia bacterium]|nr:hypothetical protein [Clostridia bacterium]
MKKVIITIILSIVSITGIGGFKIANNQSKENSINNIPEIQNEIATDENLINEEIVIPLNDGENKTSTNEETPLSEPEQNNPTDEKVVIPEKTETKETVSKPKTSNSASSGKSNTSSNQSVNTNKSTTASKQTTKNSNSDSQASKTETSTSSNSNPSPTPSTPPKETKKTPVYCYEGGSKHLGGTGPYEHGYYNSWQQAWDALTVYMENMSSGNYYVEQCLGCNKYYFYCKQD